MTLELQVARFLADARRPRRRRDRDAEARRRAQAEAWLAARRQDAACGVCGRQAGVVFLGPNVGAPLWELARHGAPASLLEDVIAASETVCRRDFLREYGKRRKGIFRIPHPHMLRASLQRSARIGGSASTTTSRSETARAEARAKPARFPRRTSHVA